MLVSNYFGTIPLMSPILVITGYNQWKVIANLETHHKNWHLLLQFLQRGNNLALTISKNLEYLRKQPVYKLLKKKAMIPWNQNWITKTVYTKLMLQHFPKEIEDRSENGIDITYLNFNREVNRTVHKTHKNMVQNVCKNRQ